MRCRGSRVHVRFRRGGAGRWDGGGEEGVEGEHQDDHH